MDFRILGPLEVLDEGQPIPLGGEKRRAVLALLLLHANETISAERLMDELWGEQPPATAPKTLQVHVSRLRKAFADAGHGHVLLTRGHGYELAVAVGELDSERFEQLLDDGRRELAGGRPEEALAALEEGLSLWRGPPLADLAYEPFAQAEIARLDDLRAAAHEQLVDAKLELGRQAEVIAPLEALIEEHPYRERLRAQLMLALYRADRQADALQAYQDARTRLVEELGIEPGERLRELERAILGQDPSLAQPASLPAEAPAELPTGVVTFLLTDIEGSSGLWESDFDAMAAALALHDELIARTVESHGGRLLKSKGEGDSTLTVFARASEAVTAAAELELMLAEAEWPPAAEPRVRVAVYTGEAHERDGDYFGPALNRAARLRALAQPGSALLSQASAEIVRDRLPAGTELIDHGRRELRGLARTEHVFELRLRAARGAAEPTATRKTVTVLFACVMDLTPALEGLDAEARRHVSSRCLAEMRAVLERHGGSVEGYPGDALMAIYGVPRLHEDDALRAVRAAEELSEAVDGVGEELGRALGLRPCVRIGIGTGDVIVESETGEPPTATGDAVTAAKRLEEAAGSGEILLDDPTHRRVRGFVESEPRSGSPPAFRLVEVRSEGERPRGEASPFVGRTGQLSALSTAFSAAVADQACHLVTVFGAAGVGKSRLVEELALTLGNSATVVRGRCLPYGESITFWPLAEIIRDLPGSIATHLAEDPKAEAVEAALSEALGLGGPRGATNEKIFWAARRLFEAAARVHPLVVVLDDLQWAEPTFLDLVEHVADLARDAPIVLMCVARPELLDARPGWGGGKLNAASVHLEALEGDETRDLLSNLLRHATLGGEPAEQLARACEGNPLYAEELVTMLIDDGRLRRDGDRWALADGGARMPVPPTIQSLLAARLEQLPDDERALLARLAVAGTVFQADAVRELAPTSLEPVLERSLMDLVRRDLIRPERAPGHGDDAYRFRHILIRDAAYGSLPKETRAELHERFADWIARTAAGRLTETEEILGYHLEQAYRYVLEAGPPRADAGELAARAAERLMSAGRRALSRGDIPAGARLLQRAAALLRDPDPRRAHLLADLGATLIEAGRLDDAAEALAASARAADAAGDAVAAARALVEQEFLRLQRAESRGTREAFGVVDESLPVFRRAGDHRGQCAALRLRAWGHWIEGRAEAAATAWEDALEHTRTAGAEHERIEVLGWIASSLFFGPTHAVEGIRRCDSIRSEVESNPVAVAEVLQPLAGLHAMRGEFARARELLATSDAVFEDFGLTLSSAVSHHAAVVELLAGDAEAAERSLRRGYENLEGMGDRALLSTTAAFLARAVLGQERMEEADELARRSCEMAAEDDLITQVLWRGVRARCLARLGQSVDAVELAREGAELAERTDFANTRADALVDLASVQSTGGHTGEARAALDAALTLYEQKGNAVAADRVRAGLVTPAGL